MTIKYTIYHQVLFKYIWSESEATDCC